MGKAINIKQIEINRAVKGAAAAGFEIGRVEVDLATGKISLFAKSDQAPVLDEIAEWQRKQKAGAKR